MDKSETAGQALHSEDEEQRREAARLMGSARTERKAQASRENGRKSLNAPGTGAHIVTEEMRAKMRAAQAARREREREEIGLSGLAAAPTEKKPVGRPRSRPVEETPKKPRGRPKKTQPTQEAVE